VSVVLAGSFRVPPEKLAALKPHTLAVIAASRAEAGCLAYSFGADLEDEGLVHVFELWADQAALDAHYQTPHMDAWRRAREALGFHDRRMVNYPVADGREA
jgi:quinol monooxygenase YgiN